MSEGTECDFSLRGSRRLQLHARASQNPPWNAALQPETRIQGRREHLGITSGFQRPFSPEKYARMRALFPPSLQAIKLDIWESLKRLPLQPLKPHFRSSLRSCLES
ncbi:uncharacterized protein [Penaeus vannamei]|uniref:uncharacterized protein n=1 Tax=Penaeus vannamei TaxID=6689 RepID=UPI000F6786B7|nr:uncharacterized protein LOC113801216 [Penaeus vannamei]